MTDFFEGRITEDPDKQQSKKKERVYVCVTVHVKQCRYLIMRDRGAKWVWWPFSFPSLFAADEVS